MKQLARPSLFTLLVLAIAALYPRLASGAVHSFAIGRHDFLLDGKPVEIHCGEIHFARVPRAYWRQRLRMCHAMGLNAVCVYLFWNFHEWTEGRFDWGGQADVAEFCRMAQEEGLWVLLRPGPYSCAEWEMGGLPWWLLRRDVALRTRDPNFMNPARRYLGEVGRVLGPLQVTHGGPILMVQVENEYGSYGGDARYLGELRQALIDAGFDVPLFACNPPDAIGRGLRSDLFQVVNFGAHPERAFAALRRFQPTGPLMNGEYYSGWFDTWGRPHRTGTVNHCLADLGYMLDHGMSFSIYMAHGGTSFGLWSGADHPFLPDTSSYDYDAPIDEAGRPIEKFWRIRELLSRHLTPGQSLPEPPPLDPTIPIEPFALGQTAAIFDNLPAPVADAEPHTMEFYGQGRGGILYRTTVPSGPAGLLRVKAVHDYAWVCLDGRQVGTMDRRSERYAVDLPARDRPARLDILIEAVGRVNFAREILDRKGLHGPVSIEPEGESGRSVALAGWQVYGFPLDAAELSALRFHPAGRAARTGPAFWRGSFQLRRTGDTFLDLRQWGKGVAWINGHCLGRFWDIGPTQTMYCPGPWLRVGANDIVVLDLIGPREARIAGLTKPILAELHPELDSLAH
jgi:beta-galactosidase